MHFIQLRARLLGWLPALVATAGVATCGDSIHIDPGTSGGTSDAGGGCSSSQDCNDFQRPFCDTASGLCVACFTANDCLGKPGTVCFKGQCTCPHEADAPAPTYCATTEGGHCADLDIAPNDCGTCGHACYGSCSGGACTDAWEPLPSDGAPEARSHHVAVWTGTRMFIWGGNGSHGLLASGGLYDPMTRRWKTISPVNAPSARRDATAIGFKQTAGSPKQGVIVWGGYGVDGPVNTGGIYDPDQDLWTTMTTPASFSARYEHTAVWAESSTLATPFMIVWGGTNPQNGHLDDGAQYDPQSDMWSPLEPATGQQDGGTFSLSKRGQHTAVWDKEGTRLIVWGGYGEKAGQDFQYLDDGAVYHPDYPSGSQWAQAELVATQGPTARASHTAAWDEATRSMLLWGGLAAPTTYAVGGAIFKDDTWTALDPEGFAPEGRTGHSAVVLQSRMILWGGMGGTVSKALGSGGILPISPTPSPWAPLETPPFARVAHTAVSTGSSMIVWGGEDGTAKYNTGGIYTLHAPR